MLQFKAAWIREGGNNLSRSFSKGFAIEDPRETATVLRRRIELHVLFSPNVTLAYEIEFRAADGTRNHTEISRPSEEKLDSLLWKQDTPWGSAIRSHTLTKIFALHTEMAAASDYQRHYNVKDEVNDNTYCFLL